MKFPIIYENNEILLINKAEGISVQGGQGIAHPLDTELSKQLGYKIYLVHRLDKETAGILIVAKSPQAASKWTQLIQTTQVKKEYKAVCFGYPVVNGKKTSSGRMVDYVEAHGRRQEAVLNFQVEETKDFEVTKTDENGNETKQTVTLSKLHVTLGTGRMHQIRIQLAKAQCPIAGDDKHGNFKLNKVARKLGIKKLQLISYRLTIPLDGKLQTFEIPESEHIFQF